MLTLLNTHSLLFSAGVLDFWIISWQVRVSRESIDSPGPGFEYRVTFLGAGVQGNVPELAVAAVGSSSSSSSRNLNCTAFRVTDGRHNRSTVLAQVLVRTDLDGGFLKPGTAYFLRVAARNAVGLGPAQDAAPAGPFATGGGRALAPEAPPGLPTQVRVYANKDDGNALRVAWAAVDDDNGAPVARYTLEYTPAADFAPMEYALQEVRALLHPAAIHIPSWPLHSPFPFPPYHALSPMFFFGCDD